jgi:DNA mismatch repair ATPase MutS
MGQVGKFYELYEDDAQIGHETLGWKMTITGVGHCRQVCASTSSCCDLFAHTVTQTWANLGTPALPLW